MTINVLHFVTEGDTITIDANEKRFPVTLEVAQIPP